MTVTADDVRALFPADATFTDDLAEAMLVGAAELITNAMSGTSASTTLLDELTRWMTAHMIASTVERMAEQEGAGGASIKYTGTFGENLSSTPYGQMVVLLDTTGTMASLGKKSAGIFAIPSFL